MKYSLSSYILTIHFKDQKMRSIFGEKVSVGGQGSFLESFSFSGSDNMYQVQGDSMGSYVHNKSLDRTGQCSITINQVSDLNKIFLTFLNSCLVSDVTPNEGLTDESVTITLSDANSKLVVTCNDCYLKGRPTLSLGGTATTRTWTFECGEIIEEMA